MFWNISSGEWAIITLLVILIALVVWILIHTLRRDGIIEERRQRREAAQEERERMREQGRLAKKLFALIKNAVEEACLGGDFNCSRYKDTSKQDVVLLAPKENKVQLWEGAFIKVVLDLTNEKKDERILVYSSDFAGDFLSYYEDQNFDVYNKVLEFVRELKSRDVSPFLNMQ